MSAQSAGRNDTFPGETLTRLGRLEATYDPDTMFDQNLPHPPLKVREAVV